MDENHHTYFFEPPAKNGDLYVSVQTYTENLIQTECADGSAIPMPNEDEDSDVTSVHPIVYMAIFKEVKDTYEHVATRYYTDYMHQPVLITDFTPKQKFAVDIQYHWFGIPHRDYTLKVYST